MSTIPFNRPAITGKEMVNIADAITRGKLSGDGFYTKACHQWLESEYQGARALLTTSGTHALEMAALLLNLQPGDEVILPSFTFTSTANAFALRGARLVFVDLDPATMNLDVACVAAAVTAATKAVVAVHYAGFSCPMDNLSQLCRDHGLVLIEDAAQAIGARYRGRLLGTFGSLSTLSFHETKNLQCGEGGALIINDKKLAEQAEILREKGTDRSRFFRGQVDKYTWQSLGSSYLPSELNAAFLMAQFDAFEAIQSDRVAQWMRYHAALKPFAKAGLLEVPEIPEGNSLNAHLFWVKVADQDRQSSLIAALKAQGITAVFHYIPLHSSPEGIRAGRFAGTDRWTTQEATRLVRLPLYFGLTSDDQDRVIEALRSHVCANA